MNKGEIISKIDSLARKVKTPGRAYSKSQREEMRKEISFLEIELAKIKFEEDLAFIIEFELKHPSHLIPEREALKNKFDELVNPIPEQNLKFVLEFKIKSFNSGISSLSSYEKTIVELVEALDYLNKNESIPSSNPNRYAKKEEIQKSLAAKFRALKAINSQLNIDLNEIQLIINFFRNDNKVNGFVYLTRAMFFKASDFEKGYGISEKSSKKMYITYNGNAYDIETEESELPKILRIRTEPDLIPFEVQDGDYKHLMGYKNSASEIIIPAKYITANSFVNGFAKVSINKKGINRPYFGLIDSTGRLVLNFKNPFFELGDVYNDVVLFKEHVYGQDKYVETWNFDYKLVSDYQGLLSGYLIYDEIKPVIDKEIDEINKIEKLIPKLTGYSVDDAYLEIKKHRDIIEFYLEYITDIEN